MGVDIEEEAYINFCVAHNQWQARSWPCFTPLPPPTTVEQVFFEIFENIPKNNFFQNVSEKLSNHWFHGTTAHTINKGKNYMFSLT